MRRAAALVSQVKGASFESQLVAAVLARICEASLLPDFLPPRRCRAQIGLLSLLSHAQQPTAHGAMFKVNDKVLCYHGPFLYEATVRTTLYRIPPLPHAIFPYSSFPFHPFPLLKSVNTFSRSWRRKIVLVREAKALAPTTKSTTKVGKGRNSPYLSVIISPLAHLLAALVPRISH
jgi:hypothetical protein